MSGDELTVVFGIGDGQCTEDELRVEWGGCVMVVDSTASIELEIVTIPE
jgi:hypothetical protein